MNALFQSSAPSSSRLNAALLILRVASALAFLFHGSAILFGAFGGFGPAGFAAYIHMPVVVGYLVGLAQFAGGLAILSGVLFRVGAVSVIIVMLGAIFLVHVPHGFDIAKGGLEYALTQCLLAVAFLLTGPGDYSLKSFAAGFLSQALAHGVRASSLPRIEGACATMGACAPRIRLCASLHR
jgi:putative oxidoreductase